MTAIVNAVEGAARWLADGLTQQAAGLAAQWVIGWVAGVTA